MNHGVSATLASSSGYRRFMASADLAILGIIGLSAVLSLFRGFVREAVALAGWIAGFWLAFNYMHVGAAGFAGWVGSPFVQLSLGFVVLLGGVLVAAGVAGRLAAKLVNVTGLGGTDRVLGMIFGAGRGAVIVAGLGNLAGVVAAGLGLGALEKFAGFILGAEFESAFIFSLLVIILISRNLVMARQRRYLK